MALCSDSRSVCPGHRACVWNSSYRVIFQLEMCAGPVLRAGVRCAEVGFFQVCCSVCLLMMAENAGAPILIIIVKSLLQINFCWSARDSASWLSEVMQAVLPNNFTFPLLNKDR